MATLSSNNTDTLQLKSSYAVSSDKNNWYDDWGSWTNRATNDGDNNSFYMGVYAYNSNNTVKNWWWAKLCFTIPSTASVTSSKKLIISMETSGTASEVCFYAIPTRAILTTYNSDTITNPTTVLTNIGTPIASAWMKKPNGDTASFENIKGRVVLTWTLEFTEKLNPGQTYYIYFAGYQSTSKALTAWDFTSTGFNGENLTPSTGSGNRGYLTLDYEYEEGAVQIYNGTKWVSATPYVYNGTKWVQAVPYVYNGTKWVVGK